MAIPRKLYVDIYYYYRHHLIQRCSRLFFAVFFLPWSRVLAKAAKSLPRFRADQATKLNKPRHLRNLTGLSPFQRQKLEIGLSGEPVPYLIIPPHRLDHRAYD